MNDIIVKVITGFSVAFGALSLCLGLYFAGSNFLIDHSGIHTEGIVASVNDDDCSTSSYICEYATIKYINTYRKTQSYIPLIGANKGHFKVGQRVPMVYDPDNSTDAMLVESRTLNTWGTWIGIIGYFLFLSPLLLFIKKLPKDTRPTEERLKEAALYTVGYLLLFSIILAALMGITMALNGGVLFVFTAPIVITLILALIMKKVRATRIGITTGLLLGILLCLILTIGGKTDYTEVIGMAFYALFLSPFLASVTGALISWYTQKYGKK